MTGVIAPGDAFLEWGWRIPFLLSFVLIGVGYFVRRAVEESPVFLEIAEKKKQPKVPIVELFRKHWLLVILAALVFVGNNAAGYMATGGFIPSYATDPNGVVGLGKTPVLIAMTFAAAMWLVFTALAGGLADTIGRKRTYLIGYVAMALTVFPLFLLINTGQLWALYLALLLLTFGLGLTYGPQAAWYSEIFPASVRFSGVSISYAIGAILGGAFSPLIAQWLLQATGTSLAISAYLLLTTLIGLAAVLMLKDRSGIDLSINNQAEQEVGATIFDKRQPAASSVR
jgi:MFS family permease